MTYMTKSMGTCLMTVSKGEIYLASVLFSNLEGIKIRPVLIVFCEEDDDDVIGVFLTSQQARDSLDIPIERWQEAGLIKPSVVRTSKPGTYHQNRLLKKLGTLNNEEFARVLNACQSIYQ